MFKGKKKDAKNKSQAEMAPPVPTQPTSDFAPPPLPARKNIAGGPLDNSNNTLNVAPGSNFPGRWRPQSPSPVISPIRSNHGTPQKMAEPPIINHSPSIDSFEEVYDVAEDDRSPTQNSYKTCISYVEMKNSKGEMLEESQDIYDVPEEDLHRMPPPPPITNKYSYQSFPGADEFPPPPPQSNYKYNNSYKNSYNDNNDDGEVYELPTNEDGFPPQASYMGHTQQYRPVTPDQEIYDVPESVDHTLINNRPITPEDMYIPPDEFNNQFMESQEMYDCPDNIDDRARRPETPQDVYDVPDTEMNSHHANSSSRLDSPQDVYDIPDSDPHQYNMQMHLPETPRNQRQEQNRNNRFIDEISQDIYDVPDTEENAHTNSCRNDSPQDVYDIPEVEQEVQEAHASHMSSSNYPYQRASYSFQTVPQELDPDQEVYEVPDSETNNNQNDDNSIFTTPEEEITHINKARLMSPPSTPVKSSFPNSPREKPKVLPTVPPKRMSIAKKFGLPNNDTTNDNINIHANNNKNINDSDINVDPPEPISPVKSLPAPPPKPKPTVPVSKQQPLKMEDQIWFKAKFGRKESDEHLRRDSIDGGFVVRPSSSDPKGYSMSIFYKGEIRNLKIRYKSNNKYSVGEPKTDELEFDSVCNIVQYHQHTALILKAGGEVTLKILN